VGADQRPDPRPPARTVPDRLTRQRRSRPPPARKQTRPPTLRRSSRRAESPCPRSRHPADVADSVPMHVPDSRTTRQHRERRLHRHLERRAAPRRGSRNSLRGRPRRWRRTSGWRRSTSGCVGLWRTRPRGMRWSLARCAPSGTGPCGGSRNSSSNSPSCVGGCRWTVRTPLYRRRRSRSARGRSGRPSGGRPRSGSGRRRTSRAGSRAIRGRGWPGRRSRTGRYRRTRRRNARRARRICPTPGCSRTGSAGLGPARTGAGEGRVGAAAAALRVVPEGHHGGCSGGAARGGGRRVLRAPAARRGGAARLRGERVGRTGRHGNRRAARGAGLGRVRRPRERTPRPRSSGRRGRTATTPPARASAGRRPADPPAQPAPSPRSSPRSTGRSASRSGTTTTYGCGGDGGGSTIWWRRVVTRGAPASGNPQSPHNDGSIVWISSGSSTIARVVPAAPDCLLALRPARRGSRRPGPGCLLRERAVRRRQPRRVRAVLAKPTVQLGDPVGQLLGLPDQPLDQPCRLGNRGVPVREQTHDFLVRWTAR